RVLIRRIKFDSNSQDLVFSQDTNEFQQILSISKFNHAFVGADQDLFIKETESKNDSFYYENHKMLALHNKCGEIYFIDGHNVALKINIKEYLMKTVKIQSFPVIEDFFITNDVIYTFSFKDKQDLSIRLNFMMFSNK